MRRVLLIVSLTLGALLCGLSARWWAPHSGLWLYALAAWALLVAPITFHLYYQSLKRQEVADVGVGLAAWRAHQPGAGAAMARALEEALTEDDLPALEALLTALDSDTAARPAVDAVRQSLRDQGLPGAPREQLLRKVREAMQPLLDHLVAAHP